MSKTIRVECPCCNTKLAIDGETEEILSADSPKKDLGASFESAVSQVKQGAQQREDAFSKAFKRTQNLDEVLSKKFEEAKRKAGENPDEKPRNPLDFD